MIEKTKYDQNFGHYGLPQAVGDFIERERHKARVDADRAFVPLRLEASERHQADARRQF